MSSVFIIIALIGLALIILNCISGIGLDLFDLGLGDGIVSLILISLGTGAALGSAFALIAINTFNTSMLTAWLVFIISMILLAMLVFIVSMRLQKLGSGDGDAIALDSLAGREYALQHDVKAGKLGELFITDCGSVPFTVWFRANENASAGATVRITGASSESPKQVNAIIIHDMYTASLLK
jgi:hypothetical protein